MSRAAPEKTGEKDERSTPRLHQSGSEAGLAGGLAKVNSEYVPVACSSALPRRKRAKAGPVPPRPRSQQFVPDWRDCARTAKQNLNERGLEKDGLE
jgi:hypothetical protein